MLLGVGVGVNARLRVAWRRDKAGTQPGGAGGPCGESSAGRLAGGGYSDVKGQWDFLAGGQLTSISADT